jgi:hypothetical protein
VNEVVVVNLNRSAEEEPPGNEAGEHLVGNIRAKSRTSRTECEGTKKE